MDFPPELTVRDLSLSVVVPTHGRTDLFLETLKSLEAQTLQIFELIVTDDSTSRADRQLIQDAVVSYEHRTGRPASYLFSRPRLGQAKNTNQGLKRARGRFVRILHSDDLLAPKALEAEVQLMDDPALNLDLLYHLVEPFKDGPRFNQQPVLSLVQPSLFFRSVLHSGTPLPSATIFSRELLEEVGGMREDFDFLCDWEFFVRLLVALHRRHGFLGRMTPGYIGWRVHQESTTGTLWHRHFLEHEQFMNELRNNGQITKALIGDRGTRDGFFATAVRYRYRRLWRDVAKMPLRQVMGSLPRILECALSKSSLRERRQPAPWTPAGSKAYADLSVGVRKTVKETSRVLSLRRKPKSNDPRTGARFVMSAYASAAIIRWGKAFAAKELGFSAGSVPAGPQAGPALPVPGNRVEIYPTMGVLPPPPGTIAILAEYNNTTNFWSLRHLLARTATIYVSQINLNAFVEPVLHQCLKFVPVGGHIETSLSDNDHLTSFGLKALLERLGPGEFRWVEQRKDGPINTMRFERTHDGHAAYTAPHTGWTFGMLTSGKRLRNVKQFVDSIEAHCDEPYEILIVSPIDLGELGERPGVRVIRFSERDDLGWITRKKNLICAEANFSDIVICHDRFSLDSDFVESFANWGFSYGLAAPRVRLNDGRRGLDWAVVSSQNNVWSSGGLLDYRAYSQYSYNPGGATIIRKAFWRDFQWNENLFWNEHEDVELCRRIQRAGGIIALTAGTLIAAEDRWVDHNPVIPYWEQNEVLIGRPVGEQRIHFISKEAAA